MTSGFGYDDSEAVEGIGLGGAGGAEVIGGVATLRGVGALGRCSGGTDWPVIETEHGESLAVPMVLSVKTGLSAVNACISEPLATYRMPTD